MLAAIATNAAAAASVGLARRSLAAGLLKESASSATELSRGMLFIRILSAAERVKIDTALTEVSKQLILTPTIIGLIDSLSERVATRGPELINPTLRLELVQCLAMIEEQTEKQLKRNAEEQLFMLQMQRQQTFDNLVNLGYFVVVVVAVLVYSLYH